MTVYEVTFNYAAPSGVMQNVLHYDVSDDDAANLQLATNVIMDSWAGQAANNFSPSIIFNSLTWRRDEPGFVGVDFQSPLAPYNGSSAVSEFSPTTALIMQKRSLGGVRPTQGRAYLGGINTAALSSVGLWEQATLTDLEGYFEFIRDFSVGGGASTLQMVIKASNPGAPNTQAYSVVDVIVGEANPGTQRRRRLGTGA